MNAELLAHRADLLQQAQVIDARSYAEPRDREAYDALLLEIETIDTQLRDSTPAGAAAPGSRLSTLTDLADRHAALGFPVLVLDASRVFESPSGSDRLFRGNRVLTAYDLADITRQLDAHEARQQAIERQRLPEHPPADPDGFHPFEAQTTELLEEHARQAAYARSTEGRLERVEAVLVEIRDALRRG